jgi:hypothetical protein
MTKEKPKKATKHPVLQFAISEAQEICRYKLFKSVKNVDLITEQVF